MSREALRLALEVLEYPGPSWLEARQPAIIALKQALEQPEPEPVAWANRVIGGRKWLSIHASKGASDKWLEYRIKEQAQGEKYEQVALYKSPPKREWQGLTDDEITLICGECAASAHKTDDISYARAVEAKLKEKNT